MVPIYVFITLAFHEIIHTMYLTFIVLVFDGHHQVNQEKVFRTQQVCGFFLLGLSTFLTHCICVDYIFLYPPNLLHAFFGGFPRFCLDFFHIIANSYCTFKNDPVKSKSFYCKSFLRKNTVFFVPTSPSNRKTWHIHFIKLLAISPGFFVQFDGSDQKTPY